ncbi:MAG: sigma-70 factor domain-containing protein, partial [Pseudanabaenaceae cyanobacterium]
MSKKIERTEVKPTGRAARPAGASEDMVRTYLHEIGRIPLLTNEEEIVYGKQVRQLSEIVQVQEGFQKEHHRLPTPQEWSEASGLAPETLDRAIQLGTRAKRKMIEANL